eukprot:939956-Rhodomonas_salina.1
MLRSRRVRERRRQLGEAAYSVEKEPAPGRQTWTVPVLIRLNTPGRRLVGGGDEEEIAEGDGLHEGEEVDKQLLLVLAPQLGQERQPATHAGRRQDARAFLWVLG